MQIPPAYDLERHFKEIKQMGRPLNKKYFGNRNIGTGGYQITGNLSNSQNYADDRIGGESVASFVIAGTNNNYTSVPTVSSIDAPTLPGGVQATSGTVLMTAKTATVTTSGTGDVTKDYLVNDVLTVVGGTGTAATFTVASTKVRTAAVQSQGTGTWVTGDTFTFSTGFSTPAVISVTATAGVIDGITIDNAGVRTATGALTDPVTPDSTTNGGGVQGVSFNLGMGVNAVTVSAGGSYSALPANAASTTTNSVNGTGATLTVSYGVLSIAVDEKGSGYTTAPSVTLSGGNASVTTTLSTDSGNVSSATNQENAIVIYANVDGNGAVVGDIIRQVSTRRYKVKTAAGISIVELEGGDTTPNLGKAMIIATSTGGTYYVTKLTAHKATLVTKTGDGALNGKAVQWTFGAPSATIVQIENA